MRRVGMMQASLKGRPCVKQACSCSQDSPPEHRTHERRHPGVITRRPNPMLVLGSHTVTLTAPSGILYHTTSPQVDAPPTRHLAHHLHRRRRVALPLQPVRKHGHLLAHRGGAGGLAVGAREHRHVSILLSQARHLADDLVHGWQDLGGRGEWGAGSSAARDA
jgi:hypothetical protein